MRALTDPSFSDFLLRVGNGEEESIDGKYVRIFDAMTIPFTNTSDSLGELIDSTFPDLDLNRFSMDYITSRAILSTKNEYVDGINNMLFDRFFADENTYYSFDVVKDDANNIYPLEFLNSLNVIGIPPHQLRLKVGCPVILLRNLDQVNGLCNGTRRAFQHNAIDEEIVVCDHAGTRVFLARIPLTPAAYDIFPFKHKRKQFPVRLSFAMTVNKTQGQTIPNVGVYLPESVFSHGQLYVALSRGTSSMTTKVLVKPEKTFDDAGVYTANEVFQEVLRDD